MPLAPTDKPYNRTKTKIKMQKESLLSGEKIISSRKMSMLVESSFWIGAIFLALSVVSFLILSFVFKGFLSLSDILSKTGLNISISSWGAIPILPTILAVIGFLYVLYAQMSVFFKEYTVTTSRIIIKSGIIDRRSSVLLPSKIEDVNVNVGIVERLLGLGKVVIAMQMDSKPSITIAGIKEPYKFQDDILKLIEKRPADYTRTDKNLGADDGIDKTS